MANTLAKVVLMSSTRIRLIFNEALAAGAFVAALYSISDVSLNSGGPTVKAALAIASANSQVELVLGSPFASGHGYAVNCAAVPGIDSTTFTGSLPFAFSVPNSPQQNVEPQKNTSDDWAFGRDLVHTGPGGDYLEDASWDLVPVGGLPNVQGAIARRVVSYGLPWDQTYGPRLDDDVDGPNATSAPATGRIRANILSDDRVQGCTVTFNLDGQNGAYFQIMPVLLTDQVIKPFNIALTQLSSSAG